MHALRRVVPGLDEHAPSPSIASPSTSSRSRSARSSGPRSRRLKPPTKWARNALPCARRIPGLYFAGCNAGARGVGTELAAASAMECADRIAFDVGRDVVGRFPRPKSLEFA